MVLNRRDICQPLLDSEMVLSVYAEDGHECRLEEGVGRRGHCSWLQAVLERNAANCSNVHPGLSEAVTRSRPPLFRAYPRGLGFEISSVEWHFL